MLPGDAQVQASDRRSNNSVSEELICNHWAITGTQIALIARSFVGFTFRSVPIHKSEVGVCFTKCVFCLAALRGRSGSGVHRRHQRRLTAGVPVSANHEAAPGGLQVQILLTGAVS